MMVINVIFSLFLSVFIGAVIVGLGVDSPLVFLVIVFGGTYFFYHKFKSFFNKWSEKIDEEVRRIAEEKKKKERLDYYRLGGNEFSGGKTSRDKNRSSVIRDEDSVRDALEDAMFNDDYISIVYYGGSQPGSIRSVKPVDVGYTYFEAEGLDGVIKTYRVDKTAIPGSSSVESGFKAYSSSVSEKYHKEQEGFETVNDAYEYVKNKLEGCNLKVEVGHNEILVYRPYKRSPNKMRKNPSLMLIFDDKSASGKKIFKKWSVLDVDDKNHGYFVHLKEAVEFLISSALKMCDRS